MIESGMRLVFNYLLGVGENHEHFLLVCDDTISMFMSYVYH